MRCSVLLRGALMIFIEARYAAVLGGAAVMGLNVLF
jgi:hypothetical protein